MLLISSKTLTHGELFAGISGFGLGFSKAGIKTLWHVEIDARCQEVLKYHYPDTLLLADVRDCDAHNLLPVDIVSFGSPCQDLSVAGKRGGLDGQRSSLFYEAVRIVAELKPAFAVWENVPGAYSSNSGRDFAAVLAAFQDIGARDIAWTCLDAQYFGVAQRRRRVFLIADFRGERAAEVLFERESSPWDSPPSREKRTNVTAPIKASTPSRRGGGSWPVAEEFIVASTLVSPHKQWNSPQNEPNLIVQHALSGHNQRNDPDGEHFVVARPLAYGQTLNHYDESQQTYVVFDTTQITSHLNRSNPQPGDPCHPLAAEAHPPAIAWYENKQGELTPSNTAKALRSGASHSYQSVGVRRLTPLECERLQGFPDGWTAVDGMKDSPRYRMLGNAVCVPVAEWIGKRIMERL